MKNGEKHNLESGKSEAGQGDCPPSLTECKLLFQIKNFSLNHFSMPKCPEFSIINNMAGGGWEEEEKEEKEPPLLDFLVTTSYKIKKLLPAFRTFSLESLNNTFFHLNSSLLLVSNIFY